MLGTETTTAQEPEFVTSAYEPITPTSFREYKLDDYKSEPFFVLQRPSMELHTMRKHKHKSSYILRSAPINAHGAEGSFEQPIIAYRTRHRLRFHR